MLVERCQRDVVVVYVEPSAVVVGSRKDRGEGGEPSLFSALDVPETGVVSTRVPDLIKVENHCTEMIFPSRRSYLSSFRLEERGLEARVDPYGTIVPHRKTLR